MLNVETWLKKSSKTLQDAGVSTARLDTLILLEDTVGKDRSWLLAHPEHELSEAQLVVLSKLTARRATHEPLAYLRSKSAFYGREFYIDHRVLEPRPESEAIIELLKHLTLPRNPTIIDIGTGSGMLAITTKLELPTATVIATDIDQACLDVAEQNAHIHQAKINFQKSDLLQAFLTDVQGIAVIIANLPYVPDSFQINPAAMAEPRIAIFGGPDGLDLYRKLFSEVQQLALQPSFILTEAMPPQHDVLASIASSAHFSLEKTDDFIQLFRPS
jgi:release factor glutamine methyltransferase